MAASALSRTQNSQAGVSSQTRLEEEIRVLSLQVDNQFSETERIVEAATAALQTSVIALERVQTSSHTRRTSASSTVLEIESCLAEISLLEREVSELSRKEEDLGKKIREAHLDWTGRIPGQIAEKKERLPNLEKEVTKLSLEIDDEKEKLKRLTNHINGLVKQLHGWATDAIEWGYVGAVRKMLKDSINKGVYPQVSCGPVRYVVERQLQNNLFGHFQRTEAILQEVHKMLDGTAPYERHPWQK